MMTECLECANTFNNNSCCICNESFCCGCTITCNDNKCNYKFYCSSCFTLRECKECKSIIKLCVSCCVRKYKDEKDCNYCCNECKNNFL